MAKTSLLTATQVAELACPYCGRRLSGDTERSSSAAASWDRCGVKVRSDGEVVALLVMAPSDQIDEALVEMVWVRSDLVGRGYGRQLVQAAAAEMVRHQRKTILAAGGRLQPTCAAPAVGFLRRVGFRKRSGERLWRLDLNQTVLERSGLDALRQLLNGLSAPGPEPAGGGVAPTSAA